MDEKKRGSLTQAQVEKLQEAVSKLGPKDHEILSDGELDSVAGGSADVNICISGCASSA